MKEITTLSYNIRYPLAAVNVDAANYLNAPAAVVAKSLWAVSVHGTARNVEQQENGNKKRSTKPENEKENR